MIKDYKIPPIGFKEYGVPFIMKVIRIYQELLPDVYRLTDKEIDFYAHLIYLNNLGFDVASKEFNNKISSMVSGITRKNRGIYGYKRTLKKKKWLLQTVDGYAIPEIFRNKDSVYFDLKIVHG